MRAMVLLRCSDEFQGLENIASDSALRRVFEALRMNDSFEIE
jgi:hypothetical protein